MIRAMIKTREATKTVSKAKKVLDILEDGSVDLLGFTPDSKLSGGSKDSGKQIGGCHCGHSTADQRFKFCNKCNGTLRKK